MSEAVAPSVLPREGVVTLYTTSYCPYCVKAKNLLARKRFAFVEVNVESDALRVWLTQTSGRRTVPQIYVGQHHVGGCDDLYALEDAKQLDGLAAEHHVPVQG